MVCQEPTLINQRALPPRRRAAYQTPRGSNRRQMLDAARCWIMRQWRLMGHISVRKDDGQRRQENQDRRRSKKSARSKGGRTEGGCSEGGRCEGCVREGGACEGQERFSGGGL